MPAVMGHPHHQAAAVALEDQGGTCPPQITGTTVHQALDPEATPHSPPVPEESCWRRSLLMIGPWPQKRPDWLKTFLK